MTECHIKNATIDLPTYICTNFCPVRISDNAETKMFASASPKKLFDSITHCFYSVLLRALSRVVTFVRQNQTLRTYSYVKNTDLSRMLRRRRTLHKLVYWRTEPEPESFKILDVHNFGRCR